MTDPTEVDSTNDMLETMKDEGAHEDCIAFIKEFPESNAAAHVYDFYEFDSMSSASQTGGGFFNELWKGGATDAYGLASEENTRRLENLFSKEKFAEEHNPHRPAPPR